MKLSQYRVRAGHYKVIDWVIYGGSKIRWQVRDELDMLVDDFATLREAIDYALNAQLAYRAIAANKRKATNKSANPELKQMLGF